MSANSPKRSLFAAVLYSPLSWAMVCILGTVLWIFCMSIDTARAWRSLLINFIFFTPLAAGLVAWPAVVLIACGTWLKPVQYPAITGLAFAPASLVAFVLLIIGRSHWAPWVNDPNLHNAMWLNSGFLFTRDGIALGIQWILSLVFVVRSRKKTSKVLAAWLVVIYCLVFSLIAFDMVMSLDPHWYSALFGMYFFISAMYAALLAWTLGALFYNPSIDTSRKRDFGSLIVAFSILTAYMLYSQLIVQWYENLPDEVRQVIPRLNLYPWVIVSAVLVITIYAGPLIFLLTRWSKRNTWYLGIYSAILLAFMWVERWWEVTPALKGPLAFALPEIAGILAMGGAFLFGAALMSRRLPNLSGLVEHEQKQQ